MGYIELKTGQVALRPAGDLSSRYTIVWEGAEQTGTDWQYKALPDGGYYCSWLWYITPSMPFDTADTLVLNTDKITNDEIGRIYFNSNGIEVKNNIIEVEDNIPYITLYIEDNAGIKAD